MNRYGVAAVFHGHAHHGTPESRTTSGIPVFNVSMSLLARAFPDQPPYRLFEVQLEAAGQTPDTSGGAEGAAAARPVPPPAGK